MTILPDPGLPPGAPIFVRHGDAQVSYAPGHEVAEVEFTVHGWRTPCTADQAWQLIAALSEALDPLVESRRVAARVARLGEGGGRDAA